MDQGFPYIKNEAGKSPLEWGRAHGESFRSGIEELAEIRKKLMLSRNPALEGKLVELATQQWEITKDYDRKLWEELEGIRQGADISLSDIVVLNNYTDFRDISADEGCSTIHSNTGTTPVCGQTWDMHSSAKNYVCAIHVPEGDEGAASVLFSLVGCVGMMGFSANGSMIGVNNLNTSDARAGVIWPVLVRKVLNQKGLDSMRDTLVATQVTSAHAYIIADHNAAEIWEITPSVQVRVSESKSHPVQFHTNHCLDAQTKAIEQKVSVARTTEERYDLLQKKIATVSDLKSLHALLSDHDGYPKSICSHFESGAQDPSFTCGGAVGDLETGELIFWRGCSEYDENYKRIDLRLAMR